ncbi:MAG: 3-isopropylmalate dehydratase small subunit [Candidatus Firestonebacteria bacterium]|nr:3-isopropylmalate dehydratase small subunit [Candidatus Firestonebacteria bacterium]
MNEFTGKVWKYRDDVNTDEIIPARYLNVSDPLELKKHCMEDIDIDFVKKVSAGDIIAAGKNFGCGSSREHAPLCIKASNVSCIIAKSFARIFYRNAINIGLPILECPEAIDDIETGDIINIDLSKGKIYNQRTKKEYIAHPFPSFMQEIISSGGLMQWVKKEKKRRII